MKFNATSGSGRDLNLHEPSSDYGIARLLWEDNTGGATRGLGVLSTAALNPRRDALAHGVDWHYLTANGKWKVDGHAFTSDIDGEPQGYGGFMDIEYTFRRGMQQRLGFEFLDRNIDLNDLGFLQPADRFNAQLSVRYQDRDGWLLHQADDMFATFAADQLQTTFSLDYFFSARQQFRVSLQWVGVKAREEGFLRIPSAPGDLIPSAKPPDLAPFDFSISQLAFQVRYRWQIAPLSDLFVVYTRLADQARRLGDSGFTDLFSNAFDDPLGDVFVVKLRYRLGS